MNKNDIQKLLIILLLQSYKLLNFVFLSNIMYIIVLKEEVFAFLF